MNLQRRSKAATLLVCEGTASALFALTGLMVVRALPFNAFGLFAAAQSWAQILVMLVDAGMGQRIARDLGSSSAMAHQNGSEIFRWRMGCTWLAAGSALLVGYFCRGSNPANGGLVSAFLLMSIVDLCSWTLKGYGHVMASGIMQVGSRLLLFGSVVLVLVLNRSLSAMATGYWVSAAIAALVVLAYWHQNGKFIQMGWPNWNALRPLLPSIYQFGAILSMSVILSRFDIVLLEHFRGPSSAGEFAAAARVLDAVRLFPMVIYSVYLPAFSAARADGVALHKLRGEALATLGLTGLAVCAAGILGRHWICFLLLGARGASAEPYLALLMVSCPFMFLNIGMLAFFLALEKYGILFAAIGAALALNLGLNGAFIPVLGASGVAWIRVVCEVIMITIYFCSVRWSAAEPGEASE